VGGLVIAPGSTIVLVCLRLTVGALEVELLPADLEELDAVAPVGVASGARYTESGMETVNG
jgi:hypothetical protein